MYKNANAHKWQHKHVKLFNITHILKFLFIISIRRPVFLFCMFCIPLDSTNEMCNYTLKFLLCFLICNPSRSTLNHNHPHLWMIRCKSFLSFLHDPDLDLDSRNQENFQSKRDLSWKEVYVRDGMV